MNDESNKSITKSDIENLTLALMTNAAATLMASPEFVARCTGPNKTVTGDLTSMTVEYTYDLFTKFKCNPKTHKLLE